LLPPETNPVTLKKEVAHFSKKSAQRLTTMQIVKTNMLGVKQPHLQGPGNSRSLRLPDFKTIVT
jgi:hypothetical protein